MCTTLPCSDVGKLKRLNETEVKLKQIDILNAVTEYCDEQKINYWLDYGTLLGAIRHEGYIPWDDDIDLGMLRPDYDRFMKEFNKNNERYKFVCFENTPDYYAAYGKVIDTETVLYEPDQNGRKLAVNIDIFVYDNAPDDDGEVKKMYAIRNRLQLVTLFSWGNQVLPKDSAAKKFAKKAFHLICKTQSGSELTKKLIANSKKYSDVETRRVGSFTSYARAHFACRKSLLDSFINVNFEGKKYKAPIGYDEWLKAIYGDYMKLPPIEERVTHHQYEAYAIV